VFLPFTLLVADLRNNKSVGNNAVNKKDHLIQSHEHLRTGKVFTSQHCLKKNIPGNITKSIIKLVKAV